jgi:hypothetical protein
METDRPIFQYLELLSRTYMKCKYSKFRDGDAYDDKLHQILGPEN